MSNIRQLYETMLDHMGPTGWWPADSKPEIILGAVLVQNTNWNNAALSLDHLYQATRFDPTAIRQLSRGHLEALIQPSGFYKNKARAIHEFFNWFHAFHDDCDLVNQTFKGDLRTELLSLHGVGPETADVLRLYVFDQITFVSDTYARRLFQALTDRTFTHYQQLHRLIDLDSSFTLADAQEFHGLIDEFGKDFLGRTSRFQESFLADFVLEL